MKKHGSTFKDLSGKRFGRLLVLREFESDTGIIRWICRCDCGKEKDIAASSLGAGRSLSCGCLKNDVTSARMIIHGGVHTPEYQAWSSMRQRCLNPNNPQYCDYGGRGISICERWEVFETFLEDMGKRPAGLSIERKNNDGNYEPSNCVWATRTKQNRNTRRAYMVTHLGQTKCLTEWVEVLGKNYEKIRGRIRIGWSFEEAIK